MQKGKSLEVDVVWDKDRGPSEERDIHYLEVEWYEVFRSGMKRKTDQGVEVVLHKDRNAMIQDGEVLFEDGQGSVRLRIKPCDCIVVYPKSIHEMGRVCFEIGNKHIPVFLNQNHEVSVAYDANLYQLLSNGNFDIRFENRVLHPDQMVKAFGNVSGNVTSP